MDIYDFSWKIQSHEMTQNEDKIFFFAVLVKRGSEISSPEWVYQNDWCKKNIDPNNRCLKSSQQSWVAIYVIIIVDYSQAENIKFD